MNLYGVQECYVLMIRLVRILLELPITFILYVIDGLKTEYTIGAESFQYQVSVSEWFSKSLVDS